MRRPWGPVVSGPALFFFFLQMDDGLGTHLPCSQYEWTHSRLVLSHSLTVLSSLADTMSRPSGENLNQAGHKSHDSQRTPWAHTPPPTATSPHCPLPGPGHQCGYMSCCVWPR